MCVVLQIYKNDLRQGNRVEFYDGDSVSSPLIYTLIPGVNVEDLRIVSTQPKMLIKLISTGAFQAGGGIFGTYRVRTVVAGLSQPLPHYCVSGRLLQHGLQLQQPWVVRCGWLLHVR